MSDISTLWDTTRGDWSLQGADLVSGNDIVTAVLISLFTDREANPDDTIPDGSSDPRGWWGDDGTNQVGSRLWLIDRAKKTQRTLTLAQEYIEESLQWLIDDGVVSKIDVYVEWTRVSTLGAQVTVYRPGNPTPIKLTTQNVFNLSQVQGWGWNEAAAVGEWQPKNILPTSIGPPPELVSAFDFETGLVDLRKPGRVLGVAGSFAPSAVQARNGSKSGGFTATDYFWLPTSTDFGFGTGDFGIEFWGYFPNPPGNQAVDMFALNGVYNLFFNGLAQMQNQPLSTSIGFFPLTNDNAWHHYYVGRQAGKVILGYDGVLSAPGFFGPNADTTYDVGSAGYLVFGNRTPDGSTLFSGKWYADRIRVYKGLCPFVSNFTPSTGLYPA